MNPSTYPSNPTSPSTASPPAALPAKAPLDTHIEQRETPANAIQNKGTETVRQLGQRGQNMFNLKDQLRRHPLTAVLSSVAIILGICGGITIGVLEYQRRKSFSYRFKNGLRQAKNRLFSPLH